MRITKKRGKGEPESKLISKKELKKALKNMEKLKEEKEKEEKDFGKD